MNKQLILTGGALLIIGGVIYWYLQQKPTPPPVKCSDYTSQSECLDAGCYWYNNACHSTPPGVEACTHLLPGDTLGYGYPNGWRTCDPIDGDLCQWDDIGKKWFLIEKDSLDCFTEHRKCYVSTATGYPTCGLWPGEGIDECGSYAKRCPCGLGGMCQPNTYCCNDYICRLMAFNTTLSLDDSLWACKKLNIPSHGGNACTYTLDEPLAATKLDGMFYWKWGFWGISSRYYIDIYYNGIWEQIWYQDWGWMIGTTGVETVSAIFETAKCIEKIRFTAESNNAETNIRPSSFVGWLNF